MSDTRRVECAECGGGIDLVLREGYYDLPSDYCPGCGVKCGDAAIGIEYATERLDDLEQAAAIAARYSYEEIMAIAGRGYQEPSSLTADELDALAAFTMLRAAGLPGHVPERLDA